MSAASNAYTQCRDLALPLPPSSIAMQNGAAVSSLMRSMGITACRTADTAGGILPFITTVSAHVSIGCEQVAVLATALDQTTRAIQCTVSAVSQSSQQQVIAANNITIELSGNAVITCIFVDQNIDLKIATTVDFGSEVITSMASDMEATIKNFSSNVQNAEKDALSTPAGNKTATLFSTQLQQTAFQGDFSTIIQESIQDFQSGNTFTLVLTGYSMIGNLNPPPNLLTNGCLVVNQSIVMQVFAQTIMDNMLTRVFDSQQASDWSNAWINDQTSKSDASHITDLTNLLTGVISIIIIIIVVVIVAFMLLKGGGISNILMTSPSPGATPGGRGNTIAAVIVAVGIILFVVGIAVIATEASAWGGGICIVIGLVMVGLGGYLLWRTNQIKKQSKEGTLKMPPQTAPKKSSMPSSTPPTVKPSSMPSAASKLPPPALAPLPMTKTPIMPIEG
jgi:hypothetical protein